MPYEIVIQYHICTDDRVVSLFGTGKLRLELLVLSGLEVQAG